MTAIEEFRKDPEHNRIYLQEKALIDLTEEVCRWMHHNGISMTALAKKLKIKRKKLKRIMAGECKISLRMASDLCWALDAELKIGIELPTDWMDAKNSV